MVKACRKNKSKRITLRKKYKIIKKVKEHHRKLRKEHKANPKKYRRKDPGIPNTLPFKEEIVQHVLDTKSKFDEIRKNQFLASLKYKSNPRPANEINTNKRTGISQLSEFRKVVEQSDVILEVVDARDPIGTRCIQTEQEVLSARKKLVIILNKIDLVPKENVIQWLDFFRESYPTLPFKANTQHQVDHLGRSTTPWIREFISDGKKFKSSMGIGVNGLMALLGNYARHRGQTEDKNGDQIGRLVVGIVGLPNTGKSSIVNTLKRKKVTTSSNVPGQTKLSQLFQLDKHICLYDSPGIVVNKSTDPCDMVLKNCQRPESLTDPSPAVEAILRRIPKRQLIVRYGIGDYSSVPDFLVQLAIRQGKLKKGGVANTRASAHRLIQDWINGRITYHTLPPQTQEEREEAASKFKTKWSLDVELSDLIKFDEETLNAVPSRNMSDTQFCEDAVLETGKPLEMDGCSSDEEYSVDDSDTCSDSLSDEDMEED